MSEAADGPVFHIEPAGGLASRMFQYMVALSFQRLVPGSRIANVHLPEWGIQQPPIATPGPDEDITLPHAIELAELAERARSGAIRRIVYRGIGQRMENFLADDCYRGVFACTAPAVRAFDATHLVCPIWGPTAPEDKSPFHPLTPAEFYANIAADNGWKPVFVGTPASAVYLQRLQAHLPDALFITTGNPLQDFTIVRAARNIAVGVDALAWLAAWLSNAERIFLAVNGIFNPMQYPLVDLLPFGDQRYRFCLFPINYAVPDAALHAAHRRIARFWRPVAHEALQRRLVEAPRFDPDNSEILAHFDADFYLSSNPDLLQLLGAGNTEGARAHYLLLGIKEQRLPFRLSPAWYAARYPMAAVEVAQGDYRNFAHHYIAVGKARGYRPVPEPNERWWD
jgi:hypothetical protein